MTKIAIYLTGTTYPEIRYSYGDFEDWFARGLTKFGVQTVTCDVRKEEYPALDQVDGIVVTGSPASVVTDPEPWVEPLKKHLRTVLESDIPTLGVCFGHQILATAAGARVEPHALTREIGTVELSLTKAGEDHPLFQDIPVQFRAQETHEDVVTGLPPGLGIEILAENPHNPYQALAYSNNAFSVQFHPEITADIMHAYLQIYGKKLVKTGELSSEEYEEIKQGIRETSTGDTVFRNFCRIVSARL
ncbi:MAG: gamma-glutamyl-gamma-aminobutyrate hydrolase family protein [Candidatus Marinimicrobia bacterium]|nr:gamma-glutamyl-gamma-aminobutyrate hydrolase family protein [Candidatus Neomarinimicrobiota bacterium]MCF7828139.1 gamma-glutamyl-gamma-aminobutyrate hydrolase family protein [Candidatus Neomarinimicrobiota bacterium]MCF7879686.1 gamma-glutamyl-gamma-aminobutyrate hydrolase family protein [Candidatus Neomarinimicrobiota bacterium]